MLPSFETRRLSLRPRAMADFDACLAMDRDPEVTRFIPGPWRDPRKHAAFLLERLETAFGHGLGYWSIFPKTQPDQFMGWILLIPYDGRGPKVEIGWRLNRFAWGNGFATEAALPIMQHAFHTLRLECVVADIASGNVPSQRVAEKIGMRYVNGDKRGADHRKRYVMTRFDLGE